MAGETLGGMQGSHRVSVAEEREHDSDVLAKRFVEIPSNLQMKVEYNADKTTKYVGYGARGLATSATGWLLQYFEYNATKQVTSRTIAYDSWDNRASATYA